MKRVVFNQKGGVGKTSITCNLAAIGAAMGYRTLVIDLDVQGNTTHYLVGEIDAAKAVALVVVTVTRLHDGLRLGSPQGTALELTTLPYSVDAKD